MNIKIRKIPLVKLTLPPELPIMRDIPGRDTLRDFNINPPTFVEFLYSIIVDGGEAGYSYDESCEVYSIAESLLKYENNLEEFFVVTEDQYLLHIEPKLRSLRFRCWTRSMMKFVDSIMNATVEET